MHDCAPLYENSDTNGFLNPIKVSSFKKNSNFNYFCLSRVMACKLSNLLGFSLIRYDDLKIYTLWILIDSLLRSCPSSYYGVCKKLEN